MKKLALATIIGAAFAAPAQAVTVMAEDGWTLGVSGSINQFVTFTNNDNGDDVNEVRDGLLPAFLNFDMKAPTMNGLDIAAHISISPSTNADSYTAMEQREVYFTVDGSFGQILAGKALGLYGSHNILTDQSLFGVGFGTGGNGITTLGSIGLGYDYAAWRSQVRWTSPDMNGFKLALAVVDSAGGSTTLTNNGTATDGKPTGSIVTGGRDSDNLRYEADLSYAGAFDGGSFTAWLSAAQQDHDDLADDAQYWTVGGTLKVGGFEAMAQYSEAEDATEPTAASYTATSATTGTTTAAVASQATKWDQYLVQAGYRFGGTTLVSANYAELTDDNATSNDSIEKYTVGVYHDVNSNLKLVAEYTNVEDDDPAGLDQQIFALGGFVFF